MVISARLIITLGKKKKNKYKRSTAVFPFTYFN